MERDEIEELFSGLGPVSIRRFFGGKGVYHQGLIFAVDVQGELRLKGDAQTAPALEAAGGCRWVYEGKGGKPAAMPYWSVPQGAYDDPEEMTRWAKLAFEAALRSQRT